MLEISEKTHQVGEMLQELNNRINNLKPAMELIGEIVLSSVLDNFRHGGRPKKWKPLAEATIEERKKIGKWPGLILVRRGMAGGLMGSINYRAYKDKVILSANKEYAERQNRTRPFMMVQKQDWKEINDSLISYLTGDK